MILKRNILGKINYIEVNIDELESLSDYRPVQIGFLKLLGKMPVYIPSNSPTPQKEDK